MTKSTKPPQPRSRTSRPRGKRLSEGSRAKKISVTVDPSVLSAVQTEAKRAGRTLSAEITDALARDLRRRRLRALIDAYEAEHGVITDTELAELTSR